MANKRRKRRYTWFPGLGANRGSEVGFFVNQNTFTLGPIGANTEANIVVPIAADEGEDEDSSEQSSSFLNDSLGQDYFIERVVGTLYAACQQIASPVRSMTVQVGIFVGPKAPGAPTQALGASDPATYSPMLSMNVDQPWMFRRTWVLGNLGTDYTNAFGAFPPTNATLDGEAGPHVDIRSVRRVHKNERLWMSASVIQTWPFEDQGELNQPQVAFAYDLRVLGALRRARNTSTYRA